MAEVGSGQVARLGVLFERYHRALFRYFVSMNRDREQAEDLVQEVFVRMLRYRASYDPAQSFTAWMYQIARNAGVDQVRKRGTAQVVDIDTFVDRRAELVSASPGPEESAARGQDLALLRRAMDRLPDDKREILVLSRFQGMKHEDIAEVLGCEVGTVKVRVYRAIRALEQIYFELEKEKSIMNCEQARTQMLGGIESEDFAAHLASCETCRSESSRIGALWQSLDLLPMEEPSGKVRERFYEMLGARIGKDRRP